MLPERDRQLLTAYVDGELTARQRRHVDRLLRRSGEARRLLQKLQAAPHALTALGDPPVAAPPPLAVDLAPAVLQTIADRGLEPGRPQRPPDRNAPTVLPAQF